MSSFLMYFQCLYKIANIQQDVAKHLSTTPGVLKSNKVTIKTEISDTKKFTVKTEVLKTDKVTIKTSICETTDNTATASDANAGAANAREANASASDATASAAYASAAYASAANSGAANASEATVSDASSIFQSDHGIAFTSRYEAVASCSHGAHASNSADQWIVKFEDNPFSKKEPQQSSFQGW